MAGDNSDDPQQQPLAAGRRWSFDNVVLDERSLELFVGGALVKIERKPLEVLIYLIHHAGEVVTKDELFEHVWERKIFDDGVLSKAISGLRQALGSVGHEAIATVRGFGYRMVAKLAVDSSQPARPQPSDLALKAGAHPPSRPHWKLVERLGVGGLGEAWLARHEKTHEARVYKFARDGASLTSLRREVTLYRVISDTLGARAAVAHIFDWSLEQEPYFLEIEYVEGRDLQSWAESQGGLANVPMEVRLELAAQIAEAVAAAHSVGVIHKDLKPRNVLIRMSDIVGAAPKPQPKLCDFGSGGMSDPDRLHQLGITKLGLTAATQAGGGTAMYLAPEVIASQPATQKADIYALGVMLYQLVVGSFQKPLAPGWEADVQDELLREDIASAAAGAPEKRLASAEALASMLRTLDIRREARRAERADQERGARTQQAYAKLRRARAFIVALLVLSGAAIAGGVAAYRARNEAIEATATAQSINTFLTDDVLGIDPSVERPSEASYESLLARATSRVEERFVHQPAVAAHLHLLLGRRYQEIGQLDAALPHYERAVALFDLVGSSATNESIVAAERLANLEFSRGHTNVALESMRELVVSCTALNGPKALATLLLRTKYARSEIFAGKFLEGEHELLAIIEDINTADPPSAESRALFKEWLGTVLVNDLGSVREDAALRDLLMAYAKGVLAEYLAEEASDYPEARALFAEAREGLVHLIGENNDVVAQQDLSLVVALAAQREFDAANELIGKTEGFFAEWVPPHHWLRVIPKYYSAVVQLEQGHFHDALRISEEATSLCVGRECSPRVIAQIALLRARCLDLEGRHEEAMSLFLNSLHTFEELHGTTHVVVVETRIALANTQLELDLTDAANKTLAQISAGALATLPRVDHLIIGEYQRVKGLLALKANDLPGGTDSLGLALGIFSKRLGDSHWKTVRARAELARIPHATSQQ